jgi:hypothetical protein
MAMGLNPIGFSDRAFSFNKAVIKQRIIEAKMSSPEYRAEIRRIFQQANRRIQNIESKGLVSPAVMALNKGDIQGFTKFSMKHDWEDLKTEYAKAVSFLRQPTSTATGVREYNKHLMDAYGLTEDEFNLMADKIQEKFLSVSDDNFVEQYLMRYKDFTGELEAEAADVSEQIESDAQMLQAALDEDIERSAQSALDNANNIKKGLLGMLKKFGL